MALLCCFFDVVPVLWALCQDVRADKLLCRCSAADDKLRVLKGVLGQVAHLRDGSGGARIFHFLFVVAAMFELEPSLTVKTFALCRLSLQRRFRNAPCFLDLQSCDVTC